jgi:hypothetical protein
LVRLLAVSVAVAACGDNQPAIEDTRPTVAEFSTALNRDLDLLLVVDDSGATAEAQLALALGMHAFVDRLAQAIPGGLPNIHIGLITSDLGTQTSTSPPAPPIGMIGAGGCAGNGRGGVMMTGQAANLVAGNFISDIEVAGSRERNYEGQLGDVLRQYVIVGAAGCGFEQPLASMRAALDHNVENAGFLRDEAVLAILLMMDEDDCSVRDPALFGPDALDNPLRSFRCTRFGVTCLDGGNTPDEMNAIGTKGRCGPSSSPTALLDDVATFRDFVLDLKRDPRRIVVGAVIGDVEPFVVETTMVGGRLQPALRNSCSVGGSLPNGDPGVRLKNFAEQFPHPTIGSVCQLTHAGPLESFAQQIAFAMGTPCVGATLADSNPELDGLQPDCVVEDQVGDRTFTISPCETSRPPCWELETEPGTCPLFDHQLLTVLRDQPADPATVTRLRCATL